ncbi:MAG: DUF4162 domain-containing protein, partial [Candidatus Diapherotrites archaeon]|nr:DUF4162 domain-containing protein [Candidatus Diapherotrites archaeon]
HYLDEAESYADIVGIISNGKVVKTGSPEMLKRSVGNECITLELGKPAKTADLKAIKVLENIVNVKADGNSLKIYVPDAGHALNQLMALVLKMQITVKNVSVSKPTLYDVFLKYEEADASQRENHRTVEELKRTRKRIIGR